MIRRIFAATTLFILIVSLPLTALGVDRNEKLLKGDKDSYVLELQKELFTQGYLKMNPTGYYGTDTEAAVMAFQKKNGLKVDGKAGPETRKKLLGAKYAPIAEVRNVPSESVQDTQGYEALYPGDKGTDVEKLQQRLMDMGYYTYDKLTGYFGPATQSGVESFQRVNKLKVDGIAGGETLKLLYSGAAKNYTMTQGDRGDDVKAMQKKLISLGYLGGSATGYFGTTTEEVVKVFQQQHGLSADGKAGKNTLTVLNSPSALKNPGKAISAAPGEKLSPIDKMIEYSKTLQGKRYVLGGNGPSVFDCSGYVRYVLKNVGVVLPRTSYDQSKVVKYKTIDSIGDLSKGDLMFFKTSSKEIGHVGIYLGGSKFIHCAPGVGVKIETLAPGKYYYERFRWGKRIF